MAYVYRHIRLDNRQPFYIGKGSDNNNHKRAYSLIGRNKHWRHIASKHGYEVQILIDEISNSDSIHKEIEFISLYGRIDNDTGILVNMTNGGDGKIGCSPWNKGIQTGIGGFKGKRSQEYKNKISDTLIRKGIKPTPYERSDLQRKELSESMSSNGLFVIDNPNSSKRYTSLVETETGIIEIKNLKLYCNSNGINYTNLTAWSRKVTNRLHPMYKIRVISTNKL